MSALADVQRALNAIRDITNKEQAAVRLEVLRLLANTIADEARDIEGVKVKVAKPKRRKPLPKLPIPKSVKTPKQIQTAPTQQVSQQDVQPTQPQAPIAPK
jgi:chromosomal replication initiation ATPase DnaA